jgi:hypothetical protein
MIMFPSFRLVVQGGPSGSVARNFNLDVKNTYARRYCQSSTAKSEQNLLIPSSVVKAGGGARRDIRNSHANRCLLQ